MRVMTLGGLGAAVADAGATPVDLPSSQSVLSVIRGEPGGWGKVALSTTLRTVLLLPGMWLAGGKGWRLWAGASAASMTITVFLFFWYAAQERGRRDVNALEPAASSGGALPAEGGEPTLAGLMGRHARRT